jgi:hypothetical protein
MACFKQWANLTGCALAGAAGGAGIAASGVIEAGSVGALTPVAAATLLGSVLALLSAMAFAIGYGMDLAECYDANGRHDAADRVRQRVSALQGEHDRLSRVADRLRAIAA